MNAADLARLEQTDPALHRRITGLLNARRSQTGARAAATQRKIEALIAGAQA